jgi:hypothetical protein
VRGEGLTNVLGDIRVAVRSLLRSRGFTFVSVLTLAVAIGANTAIFSVVDAVLLRPLAFANPDQLVIVRLDASGAGAPELPFSDRGYGHFAEKNRSFEQFGGYTQTRWPLTGEGDPVQVAVGILTRSTFEALGVTPARGRFPSAEEDSPGGPPVTLLGHGLWVDRFASDPLGPLPPRSGQRELRRARHRGRGAPAPGCHGRGRDLRRGGAHPALRGGRLRP